MGDNENENQDALAEEAARQAGPTQLPKETLDFFGGDEIRARVFFEKYALKDENGNALEKTPKEMWQRVAKAISDTEADEEKRKKAYEDFLWLLDNFRFVPGGRIEFGAGQTKRKVTLINCYVIAVKDDSIEAIFDWCKEAARTYSYGGGVGTDISVLRPKGAPVHNAAMSSSGSVSFMEIMSETTHTIGQAGRRGALMITIRVDHPDILDFIHVKQNLDKVRYANISVRVTDEFMKAVENDDYITLWFENKVTGRIEKKIKAKVIWDELTKSAWAWAEPGIMFWDTMKRESPSEYNGMDIVTTNPCAEQPLQDYGACDLGNLNLSAFVLDPFTERARIDFDALERATRLGVRFLDDVLDYNADKHPLKQQADAAKNTRRIGLGFTGLADMFAKLRIKYDSDAAIEFADKLFEQIKNWAYDESTELAKEKGPFPLFDKDKHLSRPFVQRLNEEVKNKIAAQGLRNVAILTAPPVGSGAVLSGTSSGIEPIFAYSYTRRSESLSKGEFKVYHPLVKQYMDFAGITDESQLPEYFTVAYKIDPEFRVRLQGTIQKHIDSGISSTVNLSRDTKPEEVGKIYMEAWKAGCKSITVYREGSREDVLKVEDTNKEQEQKQQQQQAGAPQPEWERPETMIGKTVKLVLPQGSLYVTVNFDANNQVKEVFVNMGRAGSQEKSYSEAIGRMISRYLQAGGDVKNVISSLKGIRANDAISWYRGIKLYSVPDAIAKAIEIAMGVANFATPLGPGESEASAGQQLQVNQPSKAAAEESKEDKETSGKKTSPEEQEEAPADTDTESEGKGAEIQPEVCPVCGERTLVYENGCYICKNCGYTKCD
ncbi:MAG: adenosylcobalamin-dependent ribonucleoside-diphosphate reductase [Candidatus Micrarchaeia archaeon]